MFKGSILLTQLRNCNWCVAVLCLHKSKKFEACFGGLAANIFVVVGVSLILPGLQHSAFSCLLKFCVFWDNGFVIFLLTKTLQGFLTSIELNRKSN